MSATAPIKPIAAEAACYSTAAAILSWDQETRMPPEAARWRANQLATLSGKAHELQTSADWRDAIESALASASSPREQANAREMKRRFERASKIPTELVKREAALTSRAKGVWAAAREASDFPRFAPVLEELIGLAREKAECWGYPDEPYDALLETYERGATTALIGGLFDQVRPQLREIATAATRRSAEQQPTIPEGPYPVAAQQAFNREVAEALGFRFSAGRIDSSAHPFCTTLGPSDIRLTTRYDEADFTSSLFGVMHEVGHGLYEQGLADDDFGTPAGESVSLGIHESQSRLWENHIGRSRAFWEKWYPRAQAHFPCLASLPLDAFMRHVLRSEFSFIRVEADEATYDLHILLRFDLERQLVNGSLAVADLPDAWNEAFGALSGLCPPDDRRGCLQDIHWSMGGLGYFPTYTLGNLHAAQLFAASQAVPEIADSVKSADYAPLLDWLQKHVHCHGATIEPAEIIRLATGREPSAEAHLQHLRDRYLT
ncbi:carboxypeptidase M32 [Haloferula sp. A504]|uniref:carboxypeptidase M32 n=1 Tax=Haloferula sp. A504 TaxID=3373601 RepID=UPI0031C7BE91|nr:carboxypeptidase M32 [Verrucomicrobiaceae bacterium E54]